MPKAIFSFLILLCFSMGSVGCTSKSKKEPAHTLHVSVEAKIKGLDPLYADDLYSGIQTSQAYEPLLQYHYLKRPFVLVPNLAESMPEVSADGLTYKISIKKGVLFQDDPCFTTTLGKGREFTAEDVVYSFKRLADPKLASPAWWLLEGKLVGLDDWRKSVLKEGVADYTKRVEGLRALDRYTVQLKLNQRSAQLLSILAMPNTGIVPKEAVDTYGKEFLDHAVGTGPFHLVEYNPHSKVVWDQNPTYRRSPYPSVGAPGDREAGLLEDANKNLPLVDRVVVHVLVERQPAWLQFLAGKLDLSTIPKDEFSNALLPTGELSPTLQKKGMILVKATGYNVTHFAFNMAHPLLGKNKTLRQAMSMAFDVGGFIHLFFNGTAIPAQGLIPPGLEGYDPDYKNPYRQLNLAKAREYLAKAGYPNGKGLPVFEYATTAETLGRQSAEYFQKNMAAIGITLKINSYSWPQFQEAIKAQKAQIWNDVWNADYPDAESFLQLFYSKNVSPGPNDSNYMNPEYDKLYESAVLLPAGSRRTAIYKKMAAIIVEDCPWIFGVHRMNYTLVQPWLKNYKPNEFDHSRYKYYRVETRPKE